MSFARQYLDEVVQVARAIDGTTIERMVTLLADLRKRGGRLFLLGVGGSAANCAHAVNDFRKLADIEAYAPTDNVSELTSRINDEGWASVFVGWLKVSRFNKKDMLFIMSVGGGSLENNLSPNVVEAVKYAKEIGAGVLGVVGRDGGYTAQVADACIVVPTIDINLITPHTESFQAVIWHLLVSHPKLKTSATKWESVAAAPKKV